MEQFKVLLPGEPRYTVANFVIESKHYVGVFNTSIMELSPKEVFGWYLSLIVSFDNIGSMSDKEATIKMQDFSDKLTENLAADPDHPNALFLGRVTGDGHTQMMWYVNNPEQAHNYLQRLIDSRKYPFEFDYEMSLDKEWKEAHYWLDPIDD